MILPTASTIPRPHWRTRPSLLPSRLSISCASCLRDLRMMTRIESHEGDQPLVMDGWARASVSASGGAVRPWHRATVPDFYSADCLLHDPFHTSLRALRPRRSCNLPRTLQCTLASRHIATADGCRRTRYPRSAETRLELAAC